MNAQPIPTARPIAGLPVFVREFLRSPLQTASLVPSSTALAARMIAPLTTTTAPAGRRLVVVELGPGTGVVTHALLAGHREVDYLGIELNPVMAEHLQQRFPGVDVVQGAADQLARALAERELGPVDLVVSGLPWRAWAGPAGPALAAAVAASLAPTGAFTQFTYGWTLWASPARRQRDALREAFDQVSRSRPVWRNVPPAVVYTATRPRRTTPGR